MAGGEVPAETLGRRDSWGREVATGVSRRVASKPIPVELGAPRAYSQYVSRVVAASSVVEGYTVPSGKPVSSSGCLGGCIEHPAIFFPWWRRFSR
jgi:hypothetical protein